MARIRSSNTRPENIVREYLDGRIFRYQPSGILGRPDFANRRHRIAVFIDGCFWHGCPRCYRQPRSRTDYWVPKVQRNRKRDIWVTRHLRRRGWIVTRFWECEVRKDPKKAATRIMEVAAHAGS